MKITYLKYTVFALFTTLTAISCSDVVNMDEGWDPDMYVKSQPHQIRPQLSALLLLINR